MYTRASSIRSNYTTVSAKTKFIIPQRIVGGQDSIQHYNALHIADTSSLMKNNNVMNGNHNWTVKTSWPYNQTTMMANGTVVEWQDKKCVCFPKIYCKNNDHACSSATTTTTTVAKAAAPMPLSTQKHTTISRPEQSAPNNMSFAVAAAAAAASSSIYSHDAALNCCRCHERKTICTENVFDNERCCGMSKTAIEWEQIKLCAPECRLNKFTCAPTSGSIDSNQDGSHRDAEHNDNDDENDGDDTDFRNEIIRINNIYNNCNAHATADSLAAVADSFSAQAFTNTNVSMRKFKNDINLWFYWTKREALKILRQKAN